MSTKSEIRQLITQSFLSQARKSELLDLLVEQGDDEDFFDTFNRYISDAVQEKSVQYKEIIQGFDEGAARIDAHHMTQEEFALKALESATSALAVDDIAGKQAAWDEYYAAIERSERAYEQSLRQLAGDMVMAH